MNIKNISIICISLIISAIILSFGISVVNNKSGSVSVKGAAVKYVVADKALWNISFVQAGNDLEIINNKILEDTTKVKNFLKKYQLTEEEISLGQLDFVDMNAREYKDPNQKNRFIVTQTISIETNNINAVDRASKNLLELISENVYLASSYGAMKPAYIFTKLDDVKNQMIDEATIKAKSAAEQFAKNSNVKVGNIKRANQGTFVITGRNKASQYDNDELHQKDKEIRVVSTLEYYLK